MPVRNIVRYSAPDSYYHVYNRGHNKELLFYDEADYEFFECLLERCFGPEQLKDSEGKLFPWFGDEAQLNVYCLMPNHYHLLLYQGEDDTAIARAMQSLATTYTLYFNRRHKRRGSAFESAYKAARIHTDSYLLHITRYIHLNPENYKHWKHSSYEDYAKAPRKWVTAEPILDLFADRKEYLEFVDDYKELRDELAELKHSLAYNAESY
jgi:REP element-mobilizing transposase RayT